MPDVINLKELMGRPVRPAQFYADKIIPAKKGLTIIAGESGIGKSHLLLSVLMSIVANQDALGHLETHPAKILMFAEDDDEILAPYIQRIGSNFTGFNWELLDFVPDIHSYDEFLSKMREIRPNIAVIDPIITLGGINDSSRDTEVSNFLIKLKQLSEELNAGIVFTRHLNKADPKVPPNEESIFNRISGSYAWKSTTNHRIVMWKDKDFQFHLSCSSKLTADFHWNLHVNLSEGVISVDPSNGTKTRRKVSQWRAPIMEVAQKYPDAYFLPAAMTTLMKSECGVDANKDAVRKEMANLADEGNMIVRDIGRGKEYKYSVGIGEALMESTKKRYASPTDISDADEEVEIPEEVEV